jgi:hypothetical protein
MTTKPKREEIMATVRRIAGRINEEIAGWNVNEYTREISRFKTERFEPLLDLALSGERMYNVDHGDLKVLVSRLVKFAHDRWGEVVRERHREGLGEWGRWVCHEVDCNPYAGNVPSLSRKIGASKKLTAEDRADFHETYGALVPLCELVVELGKDVIKGRKSSGNKESQRYAPPEPSLRVAEMIEAATGELAEGVRRQIEQRETERLQLLLRRYMECRSSSRESPWEVVGHWSAPDVSRLLKTLPDGCYVLSSPDVAIKRAKAVAESVIDRYKVKMIGKVGPVVQARGKMSSVREISLVELHDAGATLGGTIRVSFEDGSGFDVRNDVVHSSYPKGRPGTFCRFPTTFWNVRGTGGSLLKLTTSEKFMNTEF